MNYAGTFVTVNHDRRSAWVSVSRHARRSLFTWFFIIFRYNRQCYDQHHRRHDQPQRNHHNDTPHKRSLLYTLGRDSSAAPVELANGGTILLVSGDVYASGHKELALSNFRESP